MKEQPVEWEKTLTNHVSDEGLAHKICKEFLHTAKNKKSIKNE